MIKQRFFLHVDADAFFASVEQCLHKELRGKPVVTGRDGSIGVALSYEAKQLGVERAMPIHLIRKEFPTVTMVASDYAMYQLYSDRMIEIVKQYVSSAVRKSVDECAMEITALVKDGEEAQSFALRLKETLEEKLWCTFSLGVAPTPLLAKIACSLKKPSGLSVLYTYDEAYLSLPIGKVTGLGTRTCARLQSSGVSTVKELLDAYPRLSSEYSVVLRDIVYELSGVPVAVPKARETQKSMNRARSFTKTKTRGAVYGQAVTNLSELLRQLRTSGQRTSRLSLSLKTADRGYVADAIVLPRPTRDEQACVKYFTELFDRLFCEGIWYRYVGVTVSLLEGAEVGQLDLFGERVSEESDEILFSEIDALRKRYGESMVVRGSTLTLPRRLGSHISPKTHSIVLAHPLLPGEAPARRLRYPYLGTVS